MRYWFHLIIFVITIIYYRLNSSYIRTTKIIRFSKKVNNSFVLYVLYICKNINRIKIVFIKIILLFLSKTVILFSILSSICWNYLYKEYKLTQFSDDNKFLGIWSVTFSNVIIYTVISEVRFCFIASCHDMKPLYHHLT